MAGEFALFLDATNDGIITIDRAGSITLFNRAAARIIGVPADTALGAPIERIIPVTRLPLVMERRRPEIDQTLAWRGVTIVTSRYPLVDEAGEVIGAAAVFRDISEVRRLAEEITNLRDLRALNRAIFENTSDAISVVDHDGVTVMVNAAWARVTGVSPEAVVGQPSGEEAGGGEGIHREVLRTGRPIVNRRMRVGPYHRDVVVDANPLVVDGTLRGSVAVFKDVSELMQLHDQLANARATIRKLEARYTFDDVVGESESFRASIERARIAAGTPATVLLHGESGTGKELFAHAIHNASERRNARFIRVNCAALTESVLESELFGYVEGAFTGARKGGRRGLFEEAHGGTIFLDEIGLMSLDTQAKLLRVLQEHEVRRVGGTDSIPINVRVIAATNLDLAEAVRRGTFREDLYYRLHVVPVEIPPLRARPGDIPGLAAALLEKINREYGRAIRSVGRPALELLQLHEWPGNVRELENVLRRAVVAMRPEEQVVGAQHVADLLAGGCLDPAGEPAPAVNGRSAAAMRPLAEVVAAAELHHIRTALAAHDGNRTATARALGVSLRTLQYKMQRLGVR